MPHLEPAPRYSKPVPPPTYIDQLERAWSPRPDMTGLQSFLVGACLGLVAAAALVAGLVLQTR